ncbi:hypothetical protein BATDEDRAFT_88624 [Batrachochytrium dendrobatidis JAM81]|uniref:Inhibitor I9 domain-containing protein n=2 Tax=Batrachochytrium dendrobatidis TaxID=109871 RepID=F4P3G3_BATDJ|nr:uncharacterized protein BATDEDRAFT_88624 [Batrachochytrium dendrobatidis JAM81]EGF80215.1 hypothetical protein BATDEDRAFT_88624 [Batrachochytrium dendrobatidis JAM81]KAJ8326404.1 hypothetical protein O5D80_005155 [Batrachochytrium dendrobatidis]KAK5671269.1 hypothetical protein QVD99_002299 [Batrachochytrium dendrobatidis]OAJ41049.1 hypothetical protein BDEG_24704 [Batrachochytrium dendrobatidis JEL423]|eukprot:XP_006679210.1 hypothetical protein BATDEDRAFT_88624 [Batrachochytrium dendrobatidis JAM81]
MHLYSATNRLVCLLLAVLAGLALISPLVTAQAYTSSLDYKTYLLSLKDGVGQDGLNTVVEFVHSVAGVVLTTYDSLPGIIKVEIPVSTVDALKGLGLVDVEEDAPVYALNG